MCHSFLAATVRNNSRFENCLPSYGRKARAAHARFNLKYLLLLSDFNQMWSVSTTNNETAFSGSVTVTLRTDRQTAKLTDAR
jgi:hypothetical protein